MLYKLKRNSIWSHRNGCDTRNMIINDVHTRIYSPHLPHLLHSNNKSHWNIWMCMCAILDDVCEMCHWMVYVRMCVWARLMFIDAPLVRMTKIEFITALNLTYRNRVIFFLKNWSKNSLHCITNIDNMIRTFFTADIAHIFIRALLMTFDRFAVMWGNKAPRNHNERKSKWWRIWAGIITSYFTTLCFHLCCCCCCCCFTESEMFSDK